MEKPKRPDSNLVWAILCTFLCCLPLGIVSIVYAAKVDGLYNSGDYEGAQDASDKAMKYAKIGAIVSVSLCILYVLFYVVLFGLILGLS